MANQILAARGLKPPIEIGHNWLSRYMKQTKEVQIRLARPRDYVRAYFESPERFNNWFDRVENTFIEYGINEADVYSVHETGFAMGILAAAQVITGTNTREDPVII